MRGTVQADILKGRPGAEHLIFSTELRCMMGDIQQYFVDRKVQLLLGVDLRHTTSPKPART